MILAHDDAGDGPAVLLVHPGVADRRMWDPLVPALSHAFRVVRPDLRGYGASAMPGGQYADADDLAALLDHLDVADAAVVGSSFGGRVALELATAHPGRVRELVLLNPDLDGIEPTATAAAFGAEEDRLLDAGDLEGAVRLNVNTWLGPDAELSVREALAAMQRRAFEVQLAADASDDPTRPRQAPVDLDAVAVPTLVVTGGHDMDHFRHLATHVSAGIDGAELVELGWAGHLPALERPDVVQALLLDVLRDDPAVHAP